MCSGRTSLAPVVHLFIKLPSEIRCPPRCIITCIKQTEDEIDAMAKESTVIMTCIKTE
jgi:hypothetical protein